jgi:cytochrome c oxidase cbb3-type subunit 3
MIRLLRAVVPLLLVACGSVAAPAVTGRPASGVGVGVAVRTTDLIAGPARDSSQVTNPYEGDQIALAEGERLYGWFNCAGCHGARGGGGIGPPFADAEWIYGGEPQNVFQSVVQGRPAGMPAFGGQIPDEQVWKIVAFVRSLAGGPESAGADDES